MKARVLMARLAIMLALMMSGPAVVAQEDLDFRTGLERIAERLTGLFPKVEGLTIAIQGDEVIVNLGQASGVHEGLELTVFRKGNPFHHPYTGVVLGHFEETLGALRIRAVHETYSVAVTVGSLKGPSVRVGDGVRITAGQVKLAVLPFVVPQKLQADETSMAAYLAKRLRETKRFSVVDPDEALVWLLKMGLRVEDLQQEEALAQLRGMFPTTYILYTDVQELRSKIIIDAKLMSIEAGRTLQVVSTVVDEVPRMQVARELPPTRSFLEVPRAALAAKQSQLLSFPIRGIAVGDVTGDGQPKIVVIEPARLRIYRWDGTALVPLWEDKENTRASYLAVDVADINDNGVPEIFVTSLEIDRLASFVVEWRDGTFRRVAEDMNLFFRVVGHERGRPVLLGQDLNRTAENPFQSEIKRFKWDGRAYRSTRMLPLPDVQNVYAMNFLDATEGAILALNADGTLSLFQNGETSWVSADVYYNPAVLFNVRTELSESILFKPGIGEGSIQQRLLYVDVGRNGDRMLVTSRPVSQPGVANFRLGREQTQRAEIAFLMWNNGTFVEVGRIPSIDGTIIDYQVSDLDGNGVPELILAVSLGRSQFNPFAVERSAVIVHPFPERVIAAR